MQRRQAVVLAAEVGDAVELRRAAQPAGEVVGPAVIAAAQPRRGPFRRRHQRRGTMPADVVEGPQDALGIADDKNRFAGDVGGEKRAGLGDGTAAADVLPGVAEDSPAFQFVEVRVEVPRRRDGAAPVPAAATGRIAPASPQRAQFMTSSRDFRLSGNERPVSLVYT